jgi:hypothetical protein
MQWYVELKLLRFSSYYVTYKVCVASGILEQLDGKAEAVHSQVV